MKKVYIAITSLLVFIFSTTAHALDINTAPTLVSNSSTSLSIEWSEIEDAIGYYVYYDTTTGETAGYKNEGVDLVDGTNYTLEGLEVATQYYVAITAVDLAGEESLFSPEGVFTTGGGATEEVFALGEVEATAIDSLTLRFNAGLDTSDDAEREFLIINSITGEEVFVTATEVNTEDTSELMVILDRDLILGDKYDFTILSIIDDKGRNIESGIDALTNFQVPNEFQEVELESAGEPEPEVTAEPVAVEAIPVVTQEKIEPTLSTDGGNSGEMLSSDDIEKHTEVAAEKTEKLPQTGPEHILLIILALIFGFGILTYVSKKKTS